MPWRSCWIPPCALPGHGSRRGRRPRQPAGRPPRVGGPAGGRGSEGDRAEAGSGPEPGGRRPQGCAAPEPPATNPPAKKAAAKKAPAGRKPRRRKRPHGEEDRDQEDGGDHEGSGQAGDRGRMTALVFVPLDRTEASPARRHRPRTAARAVRRPVWPPASARTRCPRRSSSRPSLMPASWLSLPEPTRCAWCWPRTSIPARSTTPATRLGQVTVTGLGWRQVQSLFADEPDAAAAVAGAGRPPRDCRWP